jgi:hypothetical protein
VRSNFWTTALFVLGIIALSWRSSRDLSVSRYGLQAFLGEAVMAGKRNLDGMIKVITFHDPDEYPLDQLKEVLTIVSELNRGDFLYVEKPRT